VKSETQHRAERLLDQATDTATRGESLTVIAGQKGAELRALRILFQINDGVRLDASYSGWVLLTVL
jgi:hypothetical protein